MNSCDHLGQRQYMTNDFAVVHLYNGEPKKSSKEVFTISIQIFNMLEV